ncbi:hypothetical protein NEMBOFW57_007840 [Staphylotrichum longicolle]|uniref:Uncharacterized protein n=1 Tax=Staphylotrichum longicolle TaxID=669026 RepID=A0AAD4EVY3_9PEZI|nr:hypothetical protein NEMBOFW57_007840 [Staphylotrichum longicolle]
MPRRSHTPAIERPEVIRVLVESRALPRKAVKELSLTNKTIFRLLYQEKRRFKIKNLTFFKDRRSPLWTAINADLPEKLAKALELGEFDTDTTSPIGRVFHANNGRGIQLLLGLCINKGANHCFDFLLKWVDNPARPFNYNRMWLYQTAKLVAQEEGRLECLIQLLDNDKEGFFPSPKALYLALLRQVRSPSAVSWLARRLPRDTDYLPTLVAQCSVKYMQPALLEAFIQRIPTARLSAVVPSAWKRGVSATALSAAASVLHLPVVDLLVRRGAYMYPRALAETSENIPNTFAAAVSHPFPRINSPSPGYAPNNANQTDKTDTPSNLAIVKWHNLTQYHAASMRTILRILIDRARFEATVTGHPASTIPTAINVAALTFIHTLRAFLLSNLPLLIAQHPGGTDPEAAAEFHAGLVRPAPAGRRTVWSWFAPEYELDHADGGADETALPLTWRPNLTWQHAMWMRDRLLDLDERQQLVQPGAVGLVPYLEAIWEMLATSSSVGEYAALYLKVEAVRGGGGAEEGSDGEERDEERYYEEGGWETSAGLWELLVAEERVTVVEKKGEPRESWFREIKRWSVHEDSDYTSSEEEEEVVEEEEENTEVQNSESVTDAEEEALLKF